MKTKLIFIAAMILLFAGCTIVLPSEKTADINELKQRLSALESKLEKNNAMLQSIINAINDNSDVYIEEENNMSENNYVEVNYNTRDNVEAMNLFLNEKNYFANIGSNFNTDNRKNDLLFTFRNFYKVRGFGIVRDGTVYAMSITLDREVYDRNLAVTYVVWNGDYIVLAINGGTDGICGFIGYYLQGLDFSTLKRTWKNNSSDFRYAGVDVFSEVINSTYYVSAYRINMNKSNARINMKTGEIDFSNENNENQIFIAVKSNNLYYGMIKKDNSSTQLLISAPRYYDIFDNYKIIANLDKSTARCFSYTKRRCAIIDFSDNIARPAYLDGFVDYTVPATVKIIPQFEYKGKYYIKKDTSIYTQFDEIEVPYDLFDDKYITLRK
ncbi:MAG: hypothetical protein LBC68_09555 [Prevotellaceae bacterium]|jgi:hypothetical protein|nr:hypothetical protein [Prevotellaceae bacterium]